MFQCYMKWEGQFEVNFLAVGIGDLKRNLAWIGEFQVNLEVGVIVLGECGWIGYGQFVVKMN